MEALFCKNNFSEIGIVKKVFFIRKHLGFTLIELMVTVAIIALMALVAIPAFSNYGQRSEFSQRMLELQTAIDQTNILAKNPEAGVSNYILNLAGSSATLYKTSISNDNAIKKIADYSSLGYTFSIGDGTSTAPNNLVCQTPNNFCCLKSDTDLTCNSVPGYTLFIFVTISNPKIPKTAQFQIRQNPFASTLTFP